MASSRIVTLTTDFGMRDGYVGAMKGVIATLAPDARIVDIAHDVAPQDVLGGAMTLAQAAPHFPPGTIHVAVVDPGVGGSRAEVLVECGGQIYVGPDNGLFSLVAEPPVLAFQIAAPAFRVDRPSATFHGRDVFAVTAAKIAAGADPRAVGPSLANLAVLPICRAAWSGDVLEGVVIHADRFGNLVTSIWAGQGATWIDGADGVVTIGEPTAGLSAPRARTYSEVERGEALAYVGSTGWLEIGVRDGSAAERMRAARGTIVRLRRVPQSIPQPSPKVPAVNP